MQCEATAGVHDNTREEKGGGVKESITLDRREAEEIIFAFMQREDDRDQLALPANNDEQRLAAMLTDKLAGRIS